MKYVVYVDDNFHPGDEEERYELGEFASAEEALAAARGVVDSFLGQGYRPGMSFGELYAGYTGFGQNPVILSDDPDCRFSAWDYAKERCRELCGAKPGGETRPASDPALRAELEAVYNRMIAALKNRDSQALMAAMLVEGDWARAAEGGDLQAEFAEATETLLAMTPELSKTRFVAIKTAGDDLAGYYCTLRDASFVNVLLLTFVRADGRWRLTPETRSFSFTPENGQDIAARVRTLIETEAILRLVPPTPRAAAPEAAGPAVEAQAFLNVLAYGYDLELRINGTPLGFRGGHSYSGLLVGAAPGAEPAEPAVLRRGMNELLVACRRTTDAPAARLTVELIAPPARPCFRLVTTRAAGRVHATFFLPDTEGGEPRPIEIEDSD